MQKIIRRLGFSNYFLSKHLYYYLETLDFQDEIREIKNARPIQKVGAFGFLLIFFTIFSILLIKVWS